MQLSSKVQALRGADGPKLVELQQVGFFPAHAVAPMRGGDLGPCRMPPVVWNLWSGPPNGFQPASSICASTVGLRSAGPEPIPDLS